MMSTQTWDFCSLVWNKVPFLLDLHSFRIYRKRYSRAPFSVSRTRNHGAQDCYLKSDLSGEEVHFCELEAEAKAGDQVELRGILFKEMINECYRPTA